MLKAQSYENVIKLIRKHLIDQSDVPAKRVLNGDSTRGVSLIKILGSDESQTTSINLSDAFIIFEPRENNSSDLNYVCKDEESITSIAAYDFVIRSYGNTSHLVSKKIFAGFRLSSVVESLLNEGIYIVSISPSENQKEFINNTLLNRCDLTITIQCNLDLGLKEKIEYFAENQNPKISVQATEEL